jgi:hypothetical protein
MLIPAGMKENSPLIQDTVGELVMVTVQKFPFFFKVTLCIQIRGWMDTKAFYTEGVTFYSPWFHRFLMKPRAG